MAEEKIYYCVGCGKVHTREKFYMSENSLHANGTLPYCKDFIKKYSYKKDKTVDLNKFQNILMQMDLPFLKDVLDSTLEAKGDTIGNYFRQLNSLPQYKGYTWNNSYFGVDSDKEVDGNIYIENKDEHDSENDKYLSEEVYSKDWRGTYTRADLEYLDEYYRELRVDFKIITKNHKDYAKKIAKASLAMDKAYEDMMDGVSGADKRYKDLKDTFDSLSRSAQFAEDKRGINDVSLGNFGVVFERVEQRQWVPEHSPIDKDDYDELIEAFSTIKKSV